MSDRINRAVTIREVRADSLPPNHPVRQMGGRMFLMGECSVIVTLDPDNCWHISIAHPDRDPSWDEIATARYRLLPDVEEMVMPLPALAEYVNHHQHCFHLVEHKTRRILLPHEF